MLSSVLFEVNDCCVKIVFITCRRHYAKILIHLAIIANNVIIRLQSFNVRSYKIPTDAKKYQTPNAYFSSQGSQCILAA